MTAAATVEAFEAQHGADALTVAARHAAWRRGNLSWGLHAGQLKARALIRNGQSRRYVLEIARRWGKSYWLLREAFEVCLRKKRARVPYAASTETSVREFLIPMATELIDTAPDELRPEIVGNEIRFKNGSRIIMQGCEDRVKANRLRGPAADIVIVDEAGFIPSPVLKYVVKSVLLLQLVTTKGVMLIASSQPETPAHQFTEFAVEAEARGAHLKATIYDAPQLDPEEIAVAMAESGGPDSVEWKREGLNERLVDPTSALVPEFTYHESQIVQVYTPVTPQGYPEPSVDRYIVGDLGFVDLSFILFAEWDFNGSMLAVVDEDVSSHATTDVVQQRVHTKAQTLWGDKPIFRRVIDASARARADLVKLQTDGDPTAENAWRLARNQDRDAAVNQLRLAIGRLAWRIHPRCVRLIAHLKGGVWNAQRTNFDRPGGVMGHYDGVAAAMYLEREVIRSHNPTPPRVLGWSQIAPQSAINPPGSDAERLLRLKQAFNRPRKR